MSEGKEQSWVIAACGQSNRYDLIATGLLGAEGRDFEEAKANRLTMIERRILRIEMLLRRAGIEPEMIDLPQAPIADLNVASLE